jgi:hypothetical protein
VDANDTRETDIPIFKVLFCLPTARWLPVASESFGTFRWQLYDEVTSIPSASGEGAMYPHRPKHYLVWCSGLVVIGGILLQKSKVAGRLIFREITKREAIADSYSLTRISEVAREFNVGR